MSNFETNFTHGAEVFVSKPTAVHHKHMQRTLTTLIRASPKTFGWLGYSERNFPLLTVPKHDAQGMLGNVHPHIPQHATICLCDRATLKHKGFHSAYIHIFVSSTTCSSY